MKCIRSGPVPKKVNKIHWPAPHGPSCDWSVRYYPNPVYSKRLTFTGQRFFTTISHPLQMAWVRPTVWNRTVSHKMIQTSTLKVLNSKTNLVEEVPCAIVLTTNAKLGNFQISPTQWANFLINYQPTDLRPIEIPPHMYVGLQNLVTYSTTLLALTGCVIPYNNSHPNSLSIKSKHLQNKTVIATEQNKGEVANYLDVEATQIHTISTVETLNFLEKNTPLALYKQFADNPAAIGQNILANTRTLMHQKELIIAVSRVNPLLGAALADFYNSNLTHDFYTNQKLDFFT